MLRFSGSSYGIGLVHGVIDSPLRHSKTKSKKVRHGNNANYVIVFDRMPELTTVIELSRVANITGLIIPELSPYSHIAWAIAYFGIPTICLDLKLLPKNVGEVFIDLDNSALLVPENRGETNLLLKQESSRWKKVKRVYEMARSVALSKSGKGLQVLSQIQSYLDVDIALSNGADGIGEIKSEVILGDDDSDNAQIVAILQRVRAATSWRSIPIRFFDYTKDKYLAKSITAKLNIGPLGFRGIRLLEIDGSFASKFRRLIDALDMNEIVIVLPMVTKAQEVDNFRSKLKLKKVRIGVLIETPAAALSVESLLQVSDYLVIGINDLTQYTMAWDRTLPHTERLPKATIVEPVSQLISKICEASRRANAFASLAIDHYPCQSLVSQIITLGVETITVSPRLIPFWKNEIRSSNAKGV